MKRVTWSEYVRELRAQLDMTQRELAAEVGVTTGTVSRWESGETTPIGSAQRTLLAIGNVTLDE